MSRNWKEMSRITAYNWAMDKPTRDGLTLGDLRELAELIRDKMDHAYEEGARDELRNHQQVEVEEAAHVVEVDQEADYDSH